MTDDIRHDPARQPADRIADGPSDRLDDLIDAIIDGAADESAWDEFRSLAGAGVEPWRRLAEAQRCASLLQTGFEAAVAPALAVSLPNERGTTRHAPRRAFASWRPALGWAAALILGLGWAGSVLVPPDPVAAPADGTLLARYLEQPFVVGELPVQVRGISAVEDGEVITYVRQIVERRPVNLYHLQLDENSNPVLREARQEPAMLASRY